MEKIKVIVRDKNTLVLDMDAKKGDIIDLRELGSIDFDLIEEVIRNKKDEVYNDKLLAKEKEFDAIKESLILNEENKYKDQINELNNKIKELEANFNNEKINFNNEIKNKEKEKEYLIKQKADEFEVKYIKELEELKNENASLKNNQSLEINNLKTEHALFISQLESKNNVLLKEKETEYQKQLNELKTKLEVVNKEKDNELLLNEQKLKDEFFKQIDELKLDLSNKEKTINELTFKKSIKNVKQTGEDLESWCNNIVFTYFQNGFDNCEWIKDNDVIKEDDENKGSKADFILKIYADNSKKDLLTSVCMDMKDENPESTHKVKNEKYYPQLDKNRKKKNCKYALLVSNLERDNDLPMFRVKEYEDMYVVRPEFLMTFINIIVSLNVRFKDLLLRTKREDELYEESNKLNEKFEELKKRYLENPLDSLNKNLESISASADKIIKAADDIKNTKRKIVESYIDEIKNKLERFNIKKITKDLDKINED